MTVLRKIARYKTPRASLKALAPLGAKMTFAKSGKPDPWARGRHLAGILTVMCDEAK